MTRYDESWCDALAEAVGTASGLAATGPIRIVFVVTDTQEGKVAFTIIDNGDEFAVSVGKLPRGEKADITITVKEAVLLELWAATKTRDAAFMAGDIKIEGAYARWLDEVAPAFATSPWAEAFAEAGAAAA